MSKKFLSAILMVGLMLTSLPTAVFAANTSSESVHKIVLSSTEGTDGSWSHTATVDGTAVNEYDYTWHADPSEAHDDVKNAPAIYYTGTEPSGDDAVYIAHDISYYPELDTSKFVKQNYDGEQEWVYYYTAEDYTGYIFSTLPVSGSEVPTSMMHSESEAYSNAVLHITEAGTYEITGDWHGQIWIDLGEDASNDPNAVVKVILNGVDVTCTVAPALVFANVYEVDNTWEDRTTYSETVDTTGAGAQVVIADGTTNNFSGENIFRLLKTKFKSDSSTEGSGDAQKKYLKIDGAFYSYMSMNIDGENKGTGVLNITSGYEGLDSELHLTLNGGNVNINAGNDGINVNEDDVSVVTINGGNLHIAAGLNGEGDGIDSNGYLVINGGTVISSANPRSDSGLDSDKGSYINGGTVLATGSTMDWPESESNQVTMNLQFSSAQSADEAIIVTDTDGKVVFAYDQDKDEAMGANSRSYQGAVISSPNLKEGEDYYVYVGGDVTGTETKGLYNASTVTGFSDDAIQQGYSDNSTNFGGRPEPPSGDTGDRPEPPSGDNGNPPEPPNGFNGERPELPADFDPSNFDPSQFGGGPGGMGMSSGPATNKVFTMTDKVNSFAGVADYSATGFTDVASDAYYADAVTWAVENSITSGTSDTTFSPDANTTRAQAVTFLWRQAGSPEPTTTDNPFTDVASDAYYYKAVLWAVENKITVGTSDTTFSPDANCTRAQIATFLWRAAGEPVLNVINPFSDVDGNDYFYDAVLWAVEEKITAGTSDTTFSPSANCTRAQIVTFLYRQANN